jgi:hypothetical protein
MGLLYQIEKKEQLLIAKRGPVKIEKVEKVQKPKKDVRQTKFPDFPDSPSESSPEVLSSLQTIGVHNVPRELVDRLKLEVKRQSDLEGRRITMSELVIQYIQTKLE